MKNIPLNKQAHDEVPSNHSGNTPFSEVMASRRAFLGGTAALSALAFMGVSPLARAVQSNKPRLPFTAVPLNGSIDDVIVPEGYTATPFIPKGTPISGSFPAYLTGNSAADQASQVGDNHDGMHFFPMNANQGTGSQGVSHHGLLVLNHEYIEQNRLHEGGATVVGGQRPVADEVRKEINAHGVSVVEIRRERGQWTVQPSALNRRITGATPMDIKGEASGHALMKTHYSPDGTKTRGTLNNCSNGFTPWGTYLTCEENWAGYFANGDADKPREHSRYGVGGTGRYLWETAPEGNDGEFVRFDASIKGASAAEDYRNEPNTFGWIVEIDPFDPDSTPVKHTSMGRFGHEGVIFAPVKPNRQVVCYSGDDSRGEYIYKYVSRDRYRPGQRGGELLDKGTLYVARFNADGSGDWLPLVHGQPGLTVADGFADQGEVLINTRLAADILGATPMDRPEWGAVNPDNGDVYFTLTNNSRRVATEAEVDETHDVINEANPRANNVWGHIIRWKEDGSDYAGTTFRWDIYLFGGDETTGLDPNHNPLTADNMLGSPDGLWFDPEGRLWIQTDGDQPDDAHNQMLVSDPATGETKRFLVGPVGCEVTGIAATPDFKTLFVNIQHPTQSWPEAGLNNPRSSTVIITRDNGETIL